MTENRTLPHFGDDEAFAERLKRAKPTPEFNLQHTDIAQTVLLDADPVTANWPPLPIGPYIPAPRELPFSERVELAMKKWWGV